MKWRTNSAALRNAQLALESLEDRQMLTVAMDVLYGGMVGQRVAQNTDGHPIWLTDTGGRSEIIRVGQPEHGTLGFDLDSREAIYVPQSDYLGVDSFEVTSTGDFGTYTSTIRIDVIESVYAVPDWVLVSPGSQNTILDVLANDFSLSGGFADENTLRIVSAAGTEHGSISISDDGGHLIYTSAAGYRGSDSFNYVVEDTNGNRSAAKVTVEVAEFDNSEYFFNQAEFANAVLSGAVEHFAGVFGQLKFSPYYYEFASSSVLGPIATDFGNATNVQVNGVDEGDIAKTDGAFLYLASGTEVRIVDIRRPQEAQLVGRLSFEEPVVDLYVAESRLTVITEASPWTGGVITTNWSAPQVPEQFTVHALDVTEPAEPKVVYETVIDGDYRESRLIDGRLYAVANSPLFNSIGPQLSADGIFYEGVGDFVNRVQHLLSQWMGPSSQTTMAIGTTEQLMITWNDVARSAVENWPSTFATITTLDTLGDSGVPTDRDLVAIDSYDFDVYVSHNAVYVMSSSMSGGWNGLTNFWAPASDTVIQKFAFNSDGSGVELAATGNVSGRLSDQFSVDEYENHFRIATTSGWGGGEVSLFVLTSDSLDVISSIEDIAPNERIYSTRFDRGRAFITTYRKVDPLFVIDLSDPTEPVIKGSLKIPGYSNYLQVIDDDHVLGIGRDATDGLYAGLQISLFNVEDPDQPKRVATYTFEGDRNTWSSFANAWDLLDHHAITYVAEEGVLALPFYTFEGWGGLGVSDEALTSPAVRVFQIDAQSEQINVLGQIDFDEEAKRTLHVAGNLYAISDSKLQITELLTPDEVIASVDLNAGPKAIQIAELEFAQPFTTDVNGDGRTSIEDAELMRDAMRDLDDMADKSPQCVDVDGDGRFTPRDILVVVNQAFKDNGPQLETHALVERASATTIEELATLADAALDQLPPDELFVGPIFR